MTAPREYRFSVTRDDEVAISTSPDHVPWSLRPAASGDALLLDEGGKARLAVRRLRRFPRLRYVLLARDEELGTIEGLDILRTRYLLRFKNAPDRELHTPMFSARFGVFAGDVTRARIVMLREHLWAILFEEDEDRPELIAALARLLYARWHSE
ncbi:hypothetical protein FGE12_28675 [Aggregicoccus sp. 17bor-14]|uniref:hypothetical protein n=1 Tax=Myxococcaceae TaxID=31 RepID=UPI00129C871F|nr:MULTISPECIES: hypothetical protein [Myxococcaceae]MBF5046423.1 hypothetical protein [Simulacricoccus sp. 17bor-14]MRI92142.1 hypothetical protein [Aggregicoccus sp. 17bor-14]